MTGPFGYFIVDVKTRKTIAICTVIILAAFALGIAIGYAAASGQTSKSNHYPKKAFSGAVRRACIDSMPRTNTTRLYKQRYFETNNGKYRCLTSSNACWDNGLPRNYIAYHLNENMIIMDGKLDEKAWTEVPWSETFVDLRSKAYAHPYYVTKFKMRWSNDRLYIGAFLQDKDLWATFTSHDSKIWTENGFDILLDVDGSMFNYKQIEINVRGAMMDLLMYKSYWDAEGKKVHNMRWDSGAKRAVYYEGTINSPLDKDKYWSFELSLPFRKLAENSRRSQPHPTENEVWFAEFARPQQNLLINEKGQYEKDPNGTEFWWAWQPCYTLHGHLQDRWGLVQFKKSRTDKIFRFERWHIYKALFEMLNAMKQYKAINGFYTDEIEELDVPPYLLTRTCVDIPKIDISKNKADANFNITIKSMLLTNTAAFIRSDRYVSFL
ncbi:uncharacterized protein LOC123528165 [Mercenaria mercenaria]|uniref:uncharacterized protein LOC123528165 n=1 Tax=Mercenaria mercenaria TaxID=6596 RepID=UPI00234F0571|nr:uncharacterized protein LOC123528165 [Mercenaria mercenaria]